MKTNKTLTLAAAALSGMLAGSSARAVVAATSSTVAGVSTQLLTGAGQKAIPMDDTAKHDCKGANACKGQGGCKTGDQGCKGVNSCKGKGGCKTNTATTKPSL